MEKLYLETKKGNIPIEQDVVQKYDIKKGTTAPFSQNRIVGSEGEYTTEPSKDNSELQWEDIPRDGFRDDGIHQMDNGFEFSTSEMIDFAQGVDSD